MMRPEKDSKYITKTMRVENYIGKETGSCLAKQVHMAQDLGQKLQVFSFFIDF